MVEEKRWWRWATGLMAVVAVVAAAPGCGEEPQGGRRPADRQVETVEVALADVQTGAVPHTISIVGTLYGDEQTTISSKVAGRVLEIFADVGDRVQPGQPLARLDPTDYELVVRQQEMSMLEALARLGLETLPSDDFDVSKVATVERARFQAANARARMERARELYRQDPPLISEQEFTDLETAYQVAERNHDVAVLEARQQLAAAQARASELEAARQRLADTIVRAPGVVSQADGGDGQGPANARYAVSERAVSVGEYVGTGTRMFQLVADNPIKYRAAVPERFVGSVATGQPVRLNVEGLTQSFNGTVSRINPAIDVATRTFQVEMLVPNDDRQLKPGAFARGEITVGQRENIVFVPREAVVTFAGIDKVYTVKDDKAVEHAVTLLKRDGELLPIAEALPAGQVVVRGLNRLANEVPVRIVQ